MQELFTSLVNKLGHHLVVCFNSWFPINIPLNLFNGLEVITITIHPLFAGYTLWLFQLSYGKWPICSWFLMFYLLKMTIFIDFHRFSIAALLLTGEYPPLGVQAWRLGGARGWQRPVRDHRDQHEELGTYGDGAGATSCSLGKWRESQWSKQNAITAPSPSHHFVFGGMFAIPRKMGGLRHCFTMGVQSVPEL